MDQTNTAPGSTHMTQRLEYLLGLVAHLCTKPVPRPFPAPAFKFEAIQAEHEHCSTAALLILCLCMLVTELKLGKETCAVLCVIKAASAFTTLMKLQRKPGCWLHQALTSIM